jgi:predicted O-methyltransferase YrrM
MDEMTSVASQVDISKALALGGWMSEQELIWLATQAQRRLHIVEFGSLHGRSTRAMADNNNPMGRIWAVDPWAGDYYSEEGNPIPISTYVMPYFIKNLKDHIEMGHVAAIRMFSYQFSLPYKIDMVFIDGDHRYETVVKDIKKAFELLKFGGLICGHDYDHPNWPGVKQAVDEYVGNVEIEGTIWFKEKS